MRYGARPGGPSRGNGRPAVLRASGVALPAGAHVDRTGTTFVVFSSVATRVELCLFGAPGEPCGSERRVDLERHGHHWSAHLAGVGAGQRYGYRVSGPAPCDPAKLLVDPYAHALDGEVAWDERLLLPGEDSAPSVPRSVVVDHGFDWREDRPPAVAWSDTVIYEAHVKGLTATHPDVPPELRGTYRGLAHPAVLDHLAAIGVTTVELLPVQAFLHDRRLVEGGLRNYWGYNTLAFFAPHVGYASPCCGSPVVCDSVNCVAVGRSAGAVDEFKWMVRTLHEAGFEVVLDVVYNHTAEGGADGPVLSMRGLDEAAYYRVDGRERREHVDWTGCGNSLNVDRPAALRLVLDSLRHWVGEYHVDGFRFDLATTLGRDGGRFDRDAAFFDAVYQDPVLSQVKLIAEPWDLGPDGYQLGRFPHGWTEWNGRYRDVVRDFWRGQPSSLGHLAGCLAGSADVIDDPSRGPLASVNFATCHDGFTLADLVSYEHKHNGANLEDGRDGSDDNRSWNCGTEGPTDDPIVRRRRARHQRNLLATVFLSQGVPMVLHGDELGRTQRGNNNAYCQDGPLSWIDWEGADRALLAFAVRLAELRRIHPVLRRRNWAVGRPLPSTGAVDLAWFTPRGAPMADHDWLDPENRAVVAVFDGRAAEPAEDGSVGPSLVLMVNGGRSGILCRVPDQAWPGAWHCVLDTSEHHGGERARRYLSGEQLRVSSTSLLVLSSAP